MAGQLRAPLVTLEPLAPGVATLRAPLVTLEPLAPGLPALRESLLTVDPLTDGQPFLRSSLVAIESTNEGYRNLRTALLCIEALHPVAPGAYMSTAPFPGSLGSGVALPGLAYAFHKKPKFATNKHQAASGVSVRNALMQNPIWEFEATYEFLEDSSGLASSYRTLLGFYLARQGGFDTFLFKDKDDYQTTNDPLGTADGVTTQFAFKRTMGGFSEKVGQVDQAQPISIYSTINEAGTVPASGPYTITTAHAAAEVQDLGVTIAGTAQNLVSGAPAAGQYAYAAGVYTFPASAANAAVVIRYRWLIAPAAYSITAPNLLVFTTAPASGSIISADFQFSFVCIFTDDTADFEKFADKFWNLKTLNFETAP